MLAALIVTPVPGDPCLPLVPGTSQTQRMLTEDYSAYSFREGVVHQDRETRQQATGTGNLRLIPNYKHKPESKHGMPSVFEHPKPTAADITRQARPRLLNLLDCAVSREPEAVRDISLTLHTNTSISHFSNKQQSSGVNCVAPQ